MQEHFGELTFFLAAFLTGLPDSSGRSSYWLFDGGPNTPSS